MPASKSSSGRPKAAEAPRTSSAAAAATRSKSSTARKRSRPSAVGDGISSLVEQLVNRVIKPFDLVVLSRERIQETLDEAADRGRVTRADANELVLELVRRGREQTDDLLRDLEAILDRGRGQLGSATKQSVERIVRGADRARRTIGVGSTFPIAGYDDLTAAQVHQRLDDLTPAELRRVRDYERRHANRKSVLEALERELG
jgi:polyhydroxyalkanoate synthesis regulator phasin